MTFYRYDVNNIKKMINKLERYTYKESSNYDVCRRAICRLYKCNCQTCMFSSDNNKQQSGCGVTVGIFDEDSVYDIISRLKSILCQVEYKKFKRVVRER